MQLIFEKSRPGRGSEILPKIDVPEYEIATDLKREKALNLPEIAQSDISRHYTKLANRTFGVNDGCYTLGSCTMKYNPKINDELVAMDGFAKLHPLQPLNTVQGALAGLMLTEKLLAEITGMDAVNFQPAAGAHGEFLGMLMIKAYHKARGDEKRNKIIVPDSAHGTNPATCTMLGFKVINIPSNDKGCVDLEALKSVLDDEVAGFMLTNPNTLGIFEPEVLEITKAIHDAGGLNYYDGANLNAIMGVVRPGDMGFDVVHLNLHKTFSTPHGGGGPGSGAVGCKDILKPFLPAFHQVKKADGSFGWADSEQSIGNVKAFYGNFTVALKALAYILSLGNKGITTSAKMAVLNANYMMRGIEDHYHIAYPENCMHEFVISIENMKKEVGVTAMDIAKMLLDNNVHPPTVYFPLIVKEALMAEPTETESKESLDGLIEIYQQIYELAMKNPEALHEAPTTTPVGRLDEVKAARQPKVRYEF